MKQAHLLVVAKSMAFVILVLISPVLCSEINLMLAEDLVKNASCLKNRNIEQALKHKIKLISQRDLGWQVFDENGEFEVERAFLINKSMQLRFRWHVSPDGRVKPVSSRAEALCLQK